MQLRKRFRKVRGVGINDADYRVAVKVPTDTGWTTVLCPYYCRWSSMLARCYTERIHKNWPNYADCTVVEDWHLFSNFRKWMETQEWEGLHLDKDILVPGNKVYSLETCVFVTQEVNAFYNDHGGARGPWPIGVTFHKKTFQGKCTDVLLGKEIHLGTFQTPEEAHAAWLDHKREQAWILASRQKDERVAKALIDRYENYTG